MRGACGRGRSSDPSFLSVHYGAADTDDWRDRAVWQAANPALGDFLQPEFLEDEFRQAEASPARQNTFRRLYLNQWVEQRTRWLDLERWDQQAACPVGLAPRRPGRPLGGGRVGPRLGGRSHGLGHRGALSGRS